MRILFREVCPVPRAIKWDGQNIPDGTRRSASTSGAGGGDSEEQPEQSNDFSGYLLCVLVGDGTLSYSARLR